MSIKSALRKIKNISPKKIPALVFAVIALGLIAYLSTQAIRLQSLRNENLNQLREVEQELTELKSQDPYAKNEELQETITHIENTYTESISIYEEIVELDTRGEDTEELDRLFAQALSLLAERKYVEADDALDALSAEIEQREVQIADEFEIPDTVPENNTPPAAGQGYNRQQVSTDAGNFLISLIAADYGNTRVIVDTASASDCNNDCPVLPLSTYVSRNGAYAGVNGTYFCPASYPSCAGKTNTFDLLLMNKDKTYFNSDNNVYSNNSGVAFGGSYIRFLSSVSQWGRDTSIDSMISNFPLLVFNQQITFGGDDDPKKGSKGNRSFVANRDNTIYIGVVHNATVAESARVMSALGMDNALNLDNGGSTALWSGGYKVGPGRDIPNAILFVNR